MKNLIIQTITVASCMFLFMNFSSPDIITIAKSELSNSLVVHVESKSGSSKKGVRVVGEVCGGISCIGNTRSVNTDSDGNATITFSDGCKLCSIIIDGKSYDGKYKDGGYYSFQLR